MDSLNNIIESPYSAGIAGAFIAAAKFLPGKGVIEKLLNFFCGCVFAFFCVPGVIDHFSITSAGKVSLTSFVLGLIGLVLAASISTGIKEIKWGEIISGWLSRKG